MWPIRWLDLADGAVEGRALTALTGSCLVAFVYYIGARLGLALLTDGGGVAVFWPAAGIAAGTLLAFGRGARSWVMAGVVVATVVANLSADRGLATAIGKALCNAGEAALVALLLERWFGPGFKLDSVNRIAGFAAAAALAAAVAALGGAATMRAFHTAAPVLELWRAWLLSDVVGIITVAPFVIGIVAIARERPERRELLEAVILLAALGFMTNHIYQTPGDTWIALTPGAILFPALLLLAARNAPDFAAIGASIVAFAIICAVTFGAGRLGDGAVPVSERVFAAQAGAVLVMLSTLILAALFTERRRSEVILRQSNDRLQDSNEHLRLALGGAQLGTFSLDTASGRFEWDARAAYLHGISDLQPTTIGQFRSFIDPADRPAMDAALQQAQASGDAWNVRYKVVLPAGSIGSNRTPWIALDGSAICNADGRPVRLIGVVRDMTQQKATEERLRDQIEAERQVLAKLSASVPLSDVLEELVCAAESRSDAGMIASILFLDKEGRRLLHGAAPHLPTAYNQAINGVEIGPNVGSCGRAAFLGEPVLVADISTDPCWTAFRQLALGHGLRACSSLPIKAADGRVLGTFAVYYREVRLPSRRDLEALALVTHIAALAIERHASDQVVRDTRERLQLALDSAQLGVWSVNLRTGVFDNDARDRRHHKHNGAFPPRTLAEARRFVVLDDLPVLDAAFAAARTGGQCSVEYRIRGDEDVDPVWLAVEGTVVCDAAGAPVHLLGVTRDITKQKHMEENLRNQQRGLQRLLGALPVAIHTTDMSGHITYCNQCAIDLWGRRPRMGEDTWFTMGRFYRTDGTPMPRHECPPGIVLEKRELVRGQEAILERFDGIRVPIMPCPTPLYDETGTMTGVVNMMIDLSDQKRAEEALSDRDAQLQIAERAVLVGSFSHDVDSNVLQLSPGLAAIIGLPEQTTETAVTTWRLRVHPEDLKHLDADRRQAFAERKPEHSSEFRVLRPNGEIRWIESRNVISYDNGGCPLRVVGVNIDVTERKSAEHQKALLIAELDHRVKNALACVAAIAQHTRDCSESMDQFLQVFDGRITSMSNTHTLLSRSRWQGVSLVELVGSELAPCSAAGNTIIEGPDVLIAADAVQPLAMVIHELVTNAAKYGALSNLEGKVSVSWSWRGYGWKPGELIVVWREIGGPPVIPPARDGYGTIVIRDLIPYELGGKVDCTFSRSGVRCRLEIPGKWISGVEPRQYRTKAAQRREQGLEVSAVRD
jgi:PAS domain S-box-containing protein